MYMHMTNNIRGVFMRICGLQNVGWSLQLIHIYVYNLKGLSYEIDFENVDENWQILALTRAAVGF